MRQLYVNNFASALVGEIAAGNDILSVASAAALPVPAAGEFFLLTLIGLDANGNEVLWEIVKVTARAGNTLTVLRAQEGTGAHLWPDGTLLEARLTAGGMDGKEGAIAAGAVGQFWRGDKSWQDLAAAVRASVLTGLSAATATAAVAADSVLTAIGKLQGQINALATDKLNATANAASATKLATARTISLTGDVSGSVAFDGSGNVSLAAIVSDDSHNHVIANVDGLQAALDAKLALGGGRVVGNLTVDTGIDGGYGNGNGGSSAWGACIWGMGAAYGGVGVNDSFAPTGMYGMAWLRSLHASYDAQIGEGAYVYQAGVFKGGIGSAGIKTSGVFYGNGSGLTTLNASNLSTGILPDARLSGTYTGVSISGNAGTATAWQTARTLTVGATGKSVNGSANVSWTLAEIGAAAASHTHSYLPLAGGTVTGVTLFTSTTASTSTTSGAVEITGGLGVGGAIFAGGNITAYSDIRLKTNIQVIPDALGKVCALRGVTYTRIDSGERDTGVIAQEVQAVLPEAVKGDETLAVAYGNLAGLLIEAIKELHAEVEALKHGAA